jgi:hypothetical protein
MASQGRLVFPAMSGICLFLALGWLGALSPRARRVVALGCGGLLAILAVLAPFVAIRPAYARPADLIAAGVPASARPFDVDYGGVARLLAFEVDRDVIRPGDSVDVTLYWQALAPTRENYSVYVQIFGWQQDLGQRDTYAGGGAYPTSLWKPGQIIRDRHRIEIPQDVKGPGPAWMTAGFYQFDTMERPQAVDTQGQPVIFPILAKLSFDVPAPTWQPTAQLDANLDNRLRLIGFDAEAASAQPGQPWPVTLYWQVEAPIDRDYTAFIQLVDEAGSIVAQVDEPPLKGFYRTSAWTPGEVLNDSHSLTLPDDLRPGRYRVFAGLYDPITGYRLPVIDASGHAQDSQVLLETLDVATASE